MEIWINNLINYVNIPGVNCKGRKLQLNLSHLWLCNTNLHLARKELTKIWGVDNWHTKTFVSGYCKLPQWWFWSFRVRFLYNPSIKCDGFGRAALLSSTCRKGPSRRERKRNAAQPKPLHQQYNMASLWQIAGAFHYFFEAEPACITQKLATKRATFANADWTTLQQRRIDF